MEEECPKCEAGLPAWLATFADLMSLLMCFFVLLLSFAEIDAVRFKKMAESMKDAFGVQTEIPMNEIVKGISVIKQEFSPTTGDPSVLNEIKQETSDSEKEFLKMHDDSIAEAAAEMVEQEIQQQMQELTDALEEEIDKGMVMVEREGAKIIVRLEEKGSFGSGSDKPQKGFYDVMDRISAVLVSRKGKIIVAGHTDNIPIRTRRFRSNWELSSARAITVAHALMENKELDSSRVLIEGHADTNPLLPNDSSANRAKNRRVELILVQNDDGMAEKIVTIGSEEN